MILIPSDKMKKKALIFFIFVIFLVGFLVAAWMSPKEEDTHSSETISNLDLPSGFARADGPRKWNFPEDYGSHPEYQTEWWYYTGNLESQAGERFGYQLTIFRRALLPLEDRTERESAWAADQIYMAHFAVSDIDAGIHYDFERFGRGAAGLAGSENNPFKIWLENWSVEQVDDGRFKLFASQDEIKLDLFLNDLRGPVFHGQNGYSQKGPEPGNASYYYSQTRLDTSGFLQTAEGNYRVNGMSWKDHEFSTSALSQGQVGWDWFSMQLDDGKDLMVFQIRREDGSIDPFSSGTWIDGNGEIIKLGNMQFEINPITTWPSPNSGAEYPSGWRLKVPSLSLQLEITPSLADQEMNVSYTYWEGAVDINGTLDGSQISGMGYVELTGYAESMEGQF